MAKAARKFFVIVDTNAIWTNEENLGQLEVLPVKFRQDWDELAVHGDVTLVIPDVAITELAYQKQRQILRTYRDAKSNLQKIQATLDLGIPEIRSIDNERVGQLVSKRLREQINEITNCEILPIPYEAIAARIRTIIEASLWRLAPFKDGKTESGFRDAMVLETLLQFHRETIHSDIAFICTDDRLNTAAKRELSDAKNFGQFGDLKEYGKFLEYARERFAPEFLHAVSEKALWEFADSAWFDLSIGRELAIKFDLRIGRVTFEPPPVVGNNASPLLTGLFALGASRPLVCSGDPQFDIEDTKLLSIVGENEFHWHSTILASTPYSLQPKGIIASAMGSDGSTIFRILIVRVEWSALVSDQEVFSEMKYLRAHLLHETFGDAKAVNNLRNVWDLVGPAPE